MRRFVIKELNNNLYLGLHFATTDISNAILFKDKARALIASKMNFNTWRFIDSLVYDVDEISATEYEQFAKNLNIKVIPIEIIEDCYLE